MTEKSMPIVLRETLEKRQDDISKTLPDYIDPDRFIRVALLAVTKNRAIWECSKESILLAVMESARVGLQIDNKEATIIPYGGNAEFMPMAQGITRLMLRSPGLLKVETRVVREGDEFGYDYGLRPDLKHTPADKNGEITHAYAIMWRQVTEPTFEVMTRDEIEDARNTSRARNSPAWKDWYGEMARKVVLKRLAKYADLSPEASRAIAIDNAVTGSPWGNDYVDGVSDDYQNQLTQAHTQDGIERLKDEMEAASLKHDPELLEGLVAEGIFDTIYAADKVLTYLEHPVDVDPAEAAAETKAYRAYRDEGMTTDQAIVEVLGKRAQ